MLKDKVHLVGAPTPVRSEHQHVVAVIFEVTQCAAPVVEELDVRAPTCEAVLKLHFELHNERLVLSPLYRGEVCSSTVVLCFLWHKEAEVADKCLPRALLDPKPAGVLLVRCVLPA